MAVQQFCLRWNNHQPNFISVFSSLLNSESLVDVTLAAEGKQIQAHKVVLSACSTYFQSLFAKNPCQHPIVILKDIKFCDLKIMVDFMYCGEVNVSQDQLPAVLKTAETLKIKGLTEVREQNISLCKSISLSEKSCDSSALRRKRLRKSSTGSGSGSGSTEHTGTVTGGSEETVGSIDVPALPSSPTIKTEPSEGEGSLRHEPSTESEPGFTSQESVEDEPQPRRLSEEVQNEIKIECNELKSEEISPGATTKSPTTPAISYEHNYSTRNKDDLEHSVKTFEKNKLYSVEPSPSLTMGSKRGRLLMRQPRIKKDCENDDMNLCVPRVIERQSSEPGPSLSNSLQTSQSPNLLTVPQPTYLVKQHSSPQILSSPPSTTSTLQVQNSNTLESSAVLRQRSEELGRTLSSPQCSSILEGSRSCHCPALRPGPALGCNFCWNTIDGHGRILRRKTKYHCPECQTNLCIVPCFQEYHGLHPTKPEPPANTSPAIVPTIMKTSSM